MNNSDMPAMPQSVSHSAYDGEVTASYDFDGGQGLTKREHFAAMAFVEMLRTYHSGIENEIHGPHEDWAYEIGKEAFQAADGFLKAGDE